MDKSCKLQEKNLKDTKDVESWLETFKKIATNATGRTSEIGVILSLMFEVNDVQKLTRFGLKCDGIELQDTSRDRITNTKYIIKRLDRVAEVLSTIMANYGEQVLKEAIANVGGITTQFFKDIQDLWKTNPPNDQLDLPGTHMICLLNNAKYNETVTSASTVLKEMEYYTGLKCFEDMLENYQGRLSMRDVWLEIEEMVRQYQNGTEREREASLDL